ncbi:hypothetical protein [Bdellovibrio sp. HCB337]|uniref:hypothetical protein n=1 Tax=Bdellovibrio sp. HCB337 TaxID=3394358 RepID=UPI0039A547D7
MRKFIQNLLAASIVLGSASTVFAQYGTGTRSGGSSSGGYYTGSSSYGSSVAYGTPNEIITNFTSGSLLSGKQCKDCDSSTNITIQGMYLRTITAEWQGGAQAGIQSISGGGGQTLLTLVGLGVYNFDTNFKESFFAMGGLGIYPVIKDDGSGDYESKFGFTIGGGKRFPLWGSVNYIPTVAIVKKGDLDIGFDIEFLNFSIMF